MTRTRGTTQDDASDRPAGSVSGDQPGPDASPNGGVRMSADGRPQAYNGVVPWTHAEAPRCNHRASVGDMTVVMEISR